MTQVSVSQEIESPLDTVFEHFTTPSEDKRLDLHSDHVKEYRELERGPEHLEYEFVFQAFGMRFWGHAREDFERPRRSLLRVVGGALEGAQIELAFQTAGEGRTRVTQTTSLPPRALGPIESLFGRLLLARIKAITAVHLDEHRRDLEGKPLQKDRTPGSAQRLSPIDLLRVTRAISLPLVLLPLAAGALLAGAGTLSIVPLLLTLGGGALALLAGNLMNDIFDFPAGADHAARAMPEAVLTGSGALLDGKLSPRGAWIVAIALTLAGASCAALLTPGRPLVPLFALAGLLLSLCYQAPPLRASYRGYGLGELCIFAVFGPVPVLGSYYVQTGTVSGAALALGAVFGVGAALVLYCHHFLHWKADRLAGKRSPVATLGPQSAARVGIAISAAYALAAALAVYALRTASFPAIVAGVAPLLLLPPLLGFARERGAPAMRLLSGAFVVYVLSSGATVIALWRI